jgi:hypothetical protein
MNSLETSAQAPQPKSIQSVSKDPLKSDLDRISQHVQDVTSEDFEYPVLPRDTKNEALPFIPATEVRKRDGKTDPRLCGLLYSCVLLSIERADIQFRLNHPGIVIDDIVYDCSTFVHQHPGGGAPLRSFAGKSCSCENHPTYPFLRDHFLADTDH